MLGKPSLSSYTFGTFLAKFQNHWNFLSGQNAEKLGQMETRPCLHARVLKRFYNSLLWIWVMKYGWGSFGLRVGGLRFSPISHVSVLKCLHREWPECHTIEPVSSLGSFYHVMPLIVIIQNYEASTPLPVNEFYSSPLPAPSDRLPWTIPVKLSLAWKWRSEHQLHQ